MELSGPSRTPKVMAPNAIRETTRPVWPSVVYIILPLDTCYNRRSVKDPLVGPLAAIAAGILVARFVPFHSTELLAAIGGFVFLGVLALYRRARILAGICCLLGLFGAGALVAIANVPGAAPYIEATGRETVILGGCVVEPPAISGERERFLLALEPHARAQVTLYTKPGEELPALHYGQNIELDAKVRRPRNFGNPGAFDYATYLARQDTY